MTMRSILAAMLVVGMAGQCHAEPRVSDYYGYVPPTPKGFYLGPFARAVSYSDLRRVLERMRAGYPAAADWGPNVFDVRGMVIRIEMGEASLDVCRVVGQPKFSGGRCAESILLSLNSPISLYSIQYATQSRCFFTIYSNYLPDNDLVAGGKVDPDSIHYSWACPGKNPAERKSWVEVVDPRGRVYIYNQDMQLYPTDQPSWSKDQQNIPPEINWDSPFLNLLREELKREQGR